MPDIWMDVDAALGEVPVNIFPLIDDTDFKSIEGAVAYNAAGMALRWHFVTTAGAYTVTSVTPTTGGNYDWTDQGDSGIYTIEIPASGGASINNDTEGFGWFTGVATGILPWRGPVIGFRAAALNNSLIDGTTIDVNVTAMAAGTVTATAIATGAIDADAIASDAIAAAKIATGAITAAKFAAGAIDAAAIAANAIDAATFAADVDAEAAAWIWNAATASYGSAGTYGALLESGNVGGGAIVAASVTGAVGSVTGLTNATIADAVWDEASTGHTDAGKAGQQLWTDVDAILADTNELQTDWVNGGRLDLLLDALPTAAAIADAVWDEASTGHTDAGKAGAQLWTDIDAILADTGTDGVVVASIANNAITAAAIATGAIDADAFAADVDAEIATMVWNAATASYGGAGTYGQAVEDALADTNELQGDWANGGRLDLLVDGVISTLGVAGAGLTAVPWNAAWDAEVQSECADALTASGLTAAGIADAVWDEASTGHTDAGKAGAQLWTDIDAILADTGTDGVVVASIANNAITAAAIADNAIDAATFAADVDAEAASWIWNAAMASFGGAGTYGQAVEDTVADTNEVQGDLANGGRLDLLVDAIKAKTDSLTFTVAGLVDGNLQRVNDVALTGDGSATPWGPA